MSSNKKDTPKKERVIISLLLTKSEKEEIIQKSLEDGRSQTKFLVKALYDHGVLTKKQ